MVVMMEKRHKERLQEKFPGMLDDKPCVCLFIPDEFEFMEEALVLLLREKMREHFPDLT